MESQPTKEERILIRMAANQLKDVDYNTDRAWVNVKRRTNSGSLRKNLLFRCIVVVALLLTGGITLWIAGRKKDPGSSVEN